MTNIPRVTVDFETRSACSLRTTGTWRYSTDPSTDVLCLVFRLPHWAKGRTGLWHPAFPALGIEEPEDFSDMVELVLWILSGGLVEAHGVWFERCIWANVLSPRYGWPGIPREQWRCSAAKAASYALPRGLDDAGSALHLKVTKDTEKTEVEGVRVLKQIHTVRKVSKPRKPRKAELAAWAKAGTKPPKYLWHESRDLFERLWAYCRQDVLAEEAISDELDDLNPLETQMFLMDQAVNDRGFQLDKEAVTTALDLIAKETELLNAELARVTNGYVNKATQRDNMKVWFESEGLVLDDTQGATLDAVLTNPSLTAPARRAVELMRALGRSSTAKYQRMLDWAGHDWRVRGGLLYHGASTGRWSGSGVQPHNFPKLSPKPLDQEKAKDDDIDTLWTVLKTRDRAEINARYGGVMEALSAGLRGAIVAAPGKQLFVADYASIEARVLVWLAEDDDALAVFRNHEDPYCAFAPQVYGRIITKADKDERALCKIAVLGLGFQMGSSKFLDTCAKFGITIDDEFAAQVVAAYRAKYWRVKQLWYDQEAAAIAAVVSRNPVQCYNVKWLYKPPFLFCELPSGRRLAYPEPRVKQQTMPWGAQKDVLSYLGVDGYTHQWRRQSVYGGLLVENCLAGDTEVLTPSGWIPIQDISPIDRVWDGMEWVVHEGLIDNGVQTVISCDGIGMTSDHQVHTQLGWTSASSCDKHLRSDVWLPHGHDLCGEQRQEVAVERDVRVRDSQCIGSERVAKGQCSFVWLQDARDVGRRESYTRYGETPRLRGVAQYVRPLSLAYPSGVAQLWGAGDCSVSQMGQWIPGVLGRDGADVQTRSNDRTAGQRRRLQSGQLLLGDAQSAKPESTQYDSGERNVSRRLCRQRRRIAVNSALATRTRVFDIRNCGPRHRFVVRNAEHTRTLIVHNCVQAIARDLMAEAMLRAEASGVYELVLSVHDELVSEADEGKGSVKEFEALMSECPPWATGCPVEAEGWTGKRYRK